MTLWQSFSKLFRVAKKPETSSHEVEEAPQFVETIERNPNEFQVVTQYKGKKIRTNVFTFPEKLLGEVKG